MRSFSARVKRLEGRVEVQTEGGKARLSPEELDELAAFFRSALAEFTADSYISRQGTPEENAVWAGQCERALALIED